MLADAGWALAASAEVFNGSLNARLRNGKCIETEFLTICQEYAG